MELAVVKEKVRSCGAYAEVACAFLILLAVVLLAYATSGALSTASTLLVACAEPLRPWAACTAYNSVKYTLRE